MNGIIIINKEMDYTSRDVVNIISKKFHTKKVGHAGTLDPMATGVLVICIGTSTKLVEILTGHDKEYIAEITLGLLTDTLDITGNIIKSENVHFTKDEIINAINSMIGEYNQEVPIYSAVRINGKKLYEYARNNEEVNLPSRIVNIKSIELIDDIKYIDNKVIFSFKCTVSKGTYIRALVNDIASKLGTVGTMSKLMRTKQGIFKIENAQKLSEDLNVINPSDILECKKIIVSGDLEKDILNGKVIDNVYNSKEVLFIDNHNNTLALYHEYDGDITKLKPWKMFKNN